MSMLRSCSRSSTLRSDSGKRIYIITARRMISGLVLKQRKGGERLVMAGRYPALCPVSSLVALTEPPFAPRERVSGYCGPRAYPFAGKGCRAGSTAAGSVRCQYYPCKGTACKNMSVPGRRRCKHHGGRSTGPKTPEGRERISEAQRRRWARWLEQHSARSYTPYR